MCRSPFHLSIPLTRSVCGLAIDRAPHNGHAATAAAHVRVRLVAHVRSQPLSVQNASGSRTHEPLHDTRITHREHGRPQRPRLQNRRSASPMISQQALATTAATALTLVNVLNSCLRCCCSPSCCSHHLQPKRPNPVAEHRRVDVSFSSSDRAGSRSKRCSPEVILR